MPLHRQLPRCPLCKQQQVDPARLAQPPCPHLGPADVCQLCLVGGAAGKKDCKAGLVATRLAQAHTSQQPAHLLRNHSPLCPASGRYKPTNLSRMLGDLQSKWMMLRVCRKWRARATSSAMSSPCLYQDTRRDCKCGAGDAGWGGAGLTGFAGCRLRCCCSRVPANKQKTSVCRPGHAPACATQHPAAAVPCRHTWRAVSSCFCTANCTAPAGRGTDLCP